jgi:hypothetical protein
MGSIYNNNKSSEQNIYDAFNTLMFSGDNRIFQKMTKKIELYLKTIDLVGDVVEFGVFKGASLALWLKLRNMYEPHSITKVLGFDFYDPVELLETLTETNKNLMSDVIERVDKNELTVESINSRIEKFNKENYILVKGDACVTSKEFSELNKGFRIKLLYMDLDLGDPTLKVLENLWKHVVTGGIVVFDEYAYHAWDESVGVDTFLKSIKNEYTIFKTNIISPTLCIIKIV